MSQSRDLKSIQYLRGIAALMVVQYHFLLPLERYGSGAVPLDSFRIGTAGVDIFFVISGLIMVITTASRAITPAGFLRKRIQRIVPAYWFYTALVAIAALAIPGLLHTAVFEPVHVLKSFLFIPAYHPSDPTSIWPILVQGWTLNYEMFFYLLFAASLLISSFNLRISVLMTVLAALVVTGWILAPTSAVAYTYTSELLLEFAAGCLLGCIWVGQGSYFSRMPFWALGLMAATAICMFALANDPSGWTEHRVLYFGIPATLLVATALGIEGTHRFPDLRVLHRIGDGSYSIYLCHPFVMVGLGFIWSRIGVKSPVLDLCGFALAMAGSVLFGYLSYRVLEVGGSRLLRKWTGT